MGIHNNKWLFPHLTTKNIPEGIFILCKNVTLDDVIPLENLDKLEKIIPRTNSIY